MGHFWQAHFIDQYIVKMDMFDKTSVAITFADNMKDNIFTKTSVFSLCKTDLKYYIVEGKSKMAAMYE